MTFGATDEVGHRAVDNVVTPNDFQATILHLFGLDHTRLVYHANGREQRLIDGRTVARGQGSLAEHMNADDGIDYRFFTSIIRLSPALSVISRPSAS